MKTVIYLDVLLLVNFVVAAFLLAACADLCAAACGAVRLLLASSAASAASLILLAPALPLWIQLTYQAATALLVVAIAYGWRGWRALLRQAIWYFVLNLMLSGLVILAAWQGCTFVQVNNLACYFALSPPLLFACVAGVYLLLRVLVLCFGRPAEQPCRRIGVSLSGQVFLLDAFYDTGFALRDAASGRPVLLVYYSDIQEILPPPLRAYLAEVFSPNPGMLAVPPPDAGIRFIECHTVAGAALLPAMPAKLDSGAEITVVFAAGPPADSRIQALFGPELAGFLQERGGHHAASDSSDSADCVRL